MAISLKDEYGGQVITGDPGYPYGEPRNVSVAGDGTGTPLEEKWMKDLHGFLQALLVASGLTPSGTPDKVAASQYLDAVRYLTGHVQGNINAISTGPSNGFVNARAFFSQNGSFIGGAGDTNVLAATSFVGPTSFEIGAPATFNDLVDCNQQVTINLQGIVTGVGFTTIGNGLAGILVQAGPLHVVNASMLDGPVAMGVGGSLGGELACTGAGRIRETVVYAPDADHTFAIGDGTIIVGKSGTITAPRTWRLGDAAEGNRLKLMNFSASAITLRNGSGGVFLTAPGTLPALSGVTPGVVELVWVNNGTTAAWCGK